MDKTQTRHNIYRVVRPIDDYMYRSDKFSDYSLYEFNCKVYRQKRKDNECITNQGFANDHPLHETHVLRIRKHEAIPVIYGDKLKFLNDDSSSFDKEKNAIIALVLFKPFRNAIKDLKGDYRTWYDSFKNWHPPIEIKQLIMNAYDLNVARKRAGEIAKAQKHDSENISSDDSSDDENIKDNEKKDDDEDFHPEDFLTDTNRFNSDYDNIDLATFETDDTDPVRFPISSSPSDRTKESLNKISGNNLFRRNIALVSDSLPDIIIDKKKLLDSRTNKKP